MKIRRQMNIVLEIIKIIKFLKVQVITILSYDDGAVYALVSSYQKFGHWNAIKLYLFWEGYPEFQINIINYKNLWFRII